MGSVNTAGVRRLVPASALRQLDKQPRQAALRAVELAREMPRLVFLTALTHLAFEHLGGARMAKKEFGEPLRRTTMARTSSSAVTLAERSRASRAARSPTTSPGPRTAMICSAGAGP